MAITQEQIWMAADELAAAGERPTLAAVRRRVGGGSFTTISEAMSAWHARQAAGELPPVREPLPERLAELIEDLGAQLWTAARELAGAQIAVEREALEAARQELETERADVASFAEQLSAELEAAHQRGAQLTTDLEASVRRIRAVEAERDRQHAWAERAEGAAAERAAHVETLKEELRQAHAEAERARAEHRGVVQDLDARLKAQEQKAAAEFVAFRERILTVEEEGRAALRVREEAWTAERAEQQAREEALRTDLALRAAHLEGLKEDLARRDATAAADVLGREKLREQLSAALSRAERAEGRAETLAEQVRELLAAVQALRPPAAPAPAQEPGSPTEPAPRSRSRKR